VYAVRQSWTARRAVDGVDKSGQLSTAAEALFPWGSPVIHGVPRSMTERMI
jgi:hypothetical protein